MFEGAYPPGVTGKMIDDYFGENDKRCCWNCTAYNGEYCTKEWDDYDESYKVEERDLKDPDDFCDDWDLNEEYWEDDEE